jgi:hypothetical protein
LVCQKKLAEKNKKMQILLPLPKSLKKFPLPRLPPFVIPVPFCHSRESGNPLEIFVNFDTIRTTSEEI